MPREPEQYVPMPPMSEQAAFISEVDRLAQQKLSRRQALMLGTALLEACSAAWVFTDDLDKKTVKAHWGDVPNELNFDEQPPSLATRQNHTRAVNALTICADGYGGRGARIDANDVRGSLLLEKIRAARNVATQKEILGPIFTGYLVYSTNDFSMLGVQRALSEAKKRYRSERTSIVATSEGTLISTMGAISLGDPIETAVFTTPVFDLDDAREGVAAEVGINLIRATGYRGDIRGLTAIGFVRRLFKKPPESFVEVYGDMVDSYLETLRGQDPRNLIDMLTAFPNLSLQKNDPATRKVITPDTEVYCTIPQDPTSDETVFLSSSIAKLTDWAEHYGANVTTLPYQATGHAQTRASINAMNAIMDARLNKPEIDYAWQRHRRR